MDTGTSHFYGSSSDRRAVILTALQVEFQAVRAHLSKVQQERIPQGNIYDVGRFQGRGRPWQVAVAEIGPHIGPAAQQFERAVNHFGPEIVLFVGVAGRLKDVSLGDVVFASKAYLYEAGRAEQEFRPRTEVCNASFGMEQLARAEAREENWLGRIKPRPRGRGPNAPRVYIGPIAAGERVVASEDAEDFKLIRRYYDDALAVEMEGAGFLKAASACAGIEAAVIRGISDLIKGKAEADAAGSQKVASRHAAAFAFELLAKLDPLVRGPASELLAKLDDPVHVPPPSPDPERKLAVAILYRRNVEPDEALMRRIEAELAARGHQVFVDRHIPIGVDWANEINEKVRRADVVIPLLSARSVQSEMLAWELQSAHDEAQRRDGLPRILPVRVAFKDPFPPELAVILDRLQYFLWRGPQDDDRLVKQLLAALHEPQIPPPPPRPIPLGGLPLDSEFYVKRSSDLAFHAAIGRRDSIILLRGARQVGKTSLLARGLQRARQDSLRVAFTDFQRLNRSELQSPEALYKALGAALAEDLDLDVEPAKVWNPDVAANVNFERYLKREVLGRIEAPLFWALDEADRLFSCNFGSEIFALLRSWHNKRSMKPDEPWRRLTLAIAYATEAYLFITDLNQSPFNVGTLVPLRDFSYEQVAELNGRYGRPLRVEGELRAFFDSVGGHPYLTNRGLFEMAENGCDLASFLAQAERDEGLFGDHLRRILVLLHQDTELGEGTRGLLEGRPKLTPRCFYLLRAAGVLAGDSPKDAHPRCQLYAIYLRKHLDKDDPPGRHRP